MNRKFSITSFNFSKLEEINIKYLSSECKHPLQSYTKTINPQEAICGWRNVKEGCSLFKVLEGKVSMWYINFNTESNPQAYQGDMTEHNAVFGFPPNVWYLFKNETNEVAEMLVMSEHNMWENQQDLKIEGFYLKKNGRILQA